MRTYAKMGWMDTRVVFMGSPDFALPTLTALAESFDVVGVVTQPDRPAGRGRKVQPPPVKTLAHNLGLLVLQPPSLKDPEELNLLKSLNPDVIVVAAFGQILREAVLSMPPYGCLNVHASLLPRWRGAAPVQAAILYDDITGVTIMKMDRGLDTGPIINQRSLPIPQDMTAGLLSARLAQIGADLMVDTLPKYIHGELQPKPQDDGDATYAPKLNKADGLLDFEQPAEFLARQVRAYHPWPGTFQFFGNGRIKVLQAHAEAASDVIPGQRYIVDDHPAWGTVKGLLVLDEVQAAGKARLSGEEFLRGTKNWINN
jgi:methionyl-tRNA formyltransferase